MNLYQYLNIEEYGVKLEGKNDPGRVVIDEFLEASSQIPKHINNYMTSNDELATMCLSNCDRAEEELTKAELFRDFKKTELDFALGTLMVNSTVQVTIRKEAIKKEETYADALNKLHVAEAYVSYFSRLKNTFDKTHYLAKGREMRDEKGIKRSNYEPHENLKYSQQTEEHQRTTPNHGETNVIRHSEETSDFSL